jgi:hypothetical protein
MSVSLSSNTRAAINLADSGGQQAVAISALKIAANADKAIVAVVEQAAEALQAIPASGQGQRVDRLA